MSKSIIEMNSINEAIWELGNKMLDNSCVQFTIQYAVRMYNCIADCKCNKEVDNILIDYIKKERSVAEQYIIHCLSEQFDKTCYVLETEYCEFTYISCSFSKKELKIDFGRDINGDIKYTAYLVDTRYFPSDNKLLNNVNINDYFVKYPGYIEYGWKTENATENRPVIDYNISKSILDIREELEIFLKKDFNKFYISGENIKDDYLTGDSRIIYQKDEDYNYNYKIPDIVKRYIQLLI